MQFSGGRDYPRFGLIVRGVGEFNITKTDMNSILINGLRAGVTGLALFGGVASAQTAIFYRLRAKSPGLKVENVERPVCIGRVS